MLNVGFIFKSCVDPSLKYNVKAYQALADAIPPLPFVAVGVDEGDGELVEEGEADGDVMFKPKPPPICRNRLERSRLTVSKIVVPKDTMELPNNTTIISAAPTSTSKLLAIWLMYAPSQVHRQRKKRGEASLLKAST